jgi:hypothetical protein
MDKKTAFSLMRELENLTVEVEGDHDSEFIPDREGWDEPLFNVRLDAGSSEDRTSSRVERTWRLRVSPSKTHWAEHYSLRRVFDLAEENKVSVAIANDGLELQ